MRKTFLSIIAVLLASWAAYLAYQINTNRTNTLYTKNRVLENGARLVWQDCWFDAPDFASCARLHTAPETNGGASAFSLPVVVLRHEGFNHKKDPILYLAGGPGSGAGLGAGKIEEFWLSWFKDSDLHHDFILFDQRGTGLSEPSLRCPSYRQALRESLVNDIPSTEKTNKTRLALKKCHQKMVDDGIPIDQLSTLHNAADARDLMDALGFPLWNLYGVSYGTRLAITIEQKNPGRIRSLVLDSVYPIQKHFFREWPSLLSASLDKIFFYCDHHVACKQEYGNIETRFWETMSELKENPLRVRVTEPSLKLSHVLIDDEVFIDFLFDSQYESGSLYDLPGVIDAFNLRDHELLEDYVTGYLQSRLLDPVSEVVFRSVECKDNPPMSPSEVMALYGKYPKLQPYLSMEYDNCELWGNSDGNKSINDLTKTSTVPALVLAGEDDPVTPIEWVTDVIKQYPKSEAFTFPHISHSVMDRKNCGIELFSQFVDDPFHRPTADCREAPNY